MTTRVGYWVSIVLFTSGLFHLLVFAVDGGPWEGPVSWRKPVTFGLSFGLTLASVVWVGTLIRVRPFVVALFTAASVYEVAGITVQAWRGVPSHFNFETPFDTAITAGLAFGGGVIIFVVVWFLVTALRARHLTPSMGVAVRVGAATFLMAMVFGAVMIARGTVLARTGHVAEAYSSAGFFKPAHGVAMHGVLVLPLLAWGLTFAAVDEVRRRRVVVWVSAGYVVLVGGAVWWSLVG
ncbi:hypothetical protein [Umezawaea sp. Da 62-37]|uniref:hypothetical protein n=1 Tax=Umezawaea sp. Da 62-37 TaxID=3075927 RepID=UPI0028F74A5F|nr:hypothetical protein [Umezawaea sp. Da 62-37]WNV90029.1 hypothetical protein RM788_17545 [Umezawaea sp. Da 62-37]